MGSVGSLQIAGICASPLGTSKLSIAAPARALNPGKLPDGFEMLLVTADGSWHLRRPLLAFPRQPVGVGDLTSGLFLARVLLGDSLVAAFEFTAAAVHEVLLETQACASYELELVRAQDRIAHPRVRFEATPIGL